MGDRKAECEQAERDIVVAGLRLELHHQRRVAEVRDGGAFRAPGEVAELEEDQHQGLGGGDGRDGEVGATQPEAQPADRQARQHGHAAAGDHSDPWRDAVVDLQDRGRVGPEPEIGCVPQRKLLRVPAHQVPGDADEGEQQDPDEDVDGERALDHERQSDEGGGADDEPEQAAHVCVSHYRTLPPPRPFGLKASVRSSIRKTTICPESAPTN